MAIFRPMHMDDLEFALANLDGMTFEAMAMAYLRDEGYDVHESGGSGADGGWDARLEIGGKQGIAHASVQYQWRQKLRNDAEKVRDLEEERGMDYDLLVFLTNQTVTGAQELELEDEIEDEYGWKLRIIHRDNILGEMRQNKQDLAEDYLDIDLGHDRDHLAEIEGLRDERLAEIRNREGMASGIAGGPTLALHIIPNGIFAHSKVRSASDIPDPSVLCDIHAGYPETRGKYKITYGRMGNSEEDDAYAIIQNDGLYESVTTSATTNFGSKPPTIQGGIRRSSLGLDPSVVLTVRDALNDLSEMGFSGTAFASLSLMEAEDVEMDSATDIGGIRVDQSRTFGTDFYKTELYPLSIGDEEIIEDLEPLLSELWHQFGYEGGTPNIEDGQWNRGSIPLNGETLLEEGDL